MNFDLVEHAYDGMISLLPSTMNSQQSFALLVAIALQESKLQYRRQIRGPARGFWQFEQGGGVRGVLSHHSSREHIRAVLSALKYDDNESTSYVAIEHNDVLACAYARLLLWTLPQPIAGRGEEAKAWEQYTSAWRPGKPHPETWGANFAEAWKRADDRTLA